MELTTLDARTLVIRSTLFGTTEWFGGATVVRASTSGALSTERVGVNLLTRSALDHLERTHRIERIGQIVDGHNSYILGRLPRDLKTEYGLDVEACVGAWIGVAFGCYGMFNPPFTQLEDVLTYFRQLGLRESDSGVALGVGWTILDQRYSSMIDGVHVSITAPAGRPRASFATTPAGDSWVDASDPSWHRMVLQSDTVRVSLAVPPSGGLDPEPLRPGTDAYARSLKILRSIDEAVWQKP